MSDHARHRLPPNPNWRTHTATGVSLPPTRAPIVVGAHADGVLSAVRRCPVATPAVLSAAPAALRGKQSGIAKFAHHLRQFIEATEGVIAANHESIRAIKGAVTSTHDALDTVSKSNIKF